jgi:hypothetical protein
VSAFIRAILNNRTIVTKFRPAWSWLALYGLERGKALLVRIVCDVSLAHECPDVSMRRRLNIDQVELHRVRGTQRICKGGLRELHL